MQKSSSRLRIEDLDLEAIIAQPPRQSLLESFDGKSLVEVTSTNSTFIEALGRDAAPIYNKAKQVGSKIIKLQFPNLGLNSEQTSLEKLIAGSFRTFLKSKDELDLVHFHLTSAIVRSLDTVQFLEYWRGGSNFCDSKGPFRPKILENFQNLLFIQ